MNILSNEEAITELIAKADALLAKRRKRPTDDAMFEVLADYFCTTTSIVRDWLRSANLNEAISA